VRLRERVRADDGERGIAMIMVLGVTFVLSIFALAALGYATASLPGARHSEDYQIAGAAAEAGINDYLERLEVCDTYWKAPCANSATDNTNGGASWVSVPDTSSGVASTGQYTYKLLSSSGGLLRLEVKGRSPASACNAAQTSCVTRVFTVDLNKPGLLNYVYYTSLETTDPLLYPNYQSSFQANDYGVAGKNGVPSSGTTTSSTGSGSSKRTTTTKTTITFDAISTAQDTQSIRDNCGAQTDGSDKQYYYEGRDSASWSWTYTETVETKVTNGSGSTLSDTTSTTYPTESVPCSLTSIQFASGDTINGPLYTEDAMQINGATFKNKKTVTLWNSSDPVQPASANNWYWGSGPSASGYSPTSTTTDVALPSSNTSLEQDADYTVGGDGCLYTGPTKITLRSDGQINVVSPYTTATNSGGSTATNANCGTPGTSSGQLGNSSGATVPGPPNGVIYVQDVPGGTSCSMSTVISKLGYPNTSDYSYGNFSCSDGTAYVSGSGFNGDYTIGTQQDLYIVGDTTYASFSGTDSLGLVANGFVYVYNPVNTSGNELMSTPVTNIDAAILSVDDSFTVENYNRGSHVGTLNVDGGIYQLYRGPVGTGGSGGCASAGSTGYCKNYTYDSRLPYEPPPYFLDPVDAQWQVVQQTQQSSNNS
jgi:hypothetical protein